VSDRAFAFVTGGGTAGHVLPALAVAEALVDRGHAVEDIHYIGAQRGIETRLVPPTGHPATYLDVVGVQRRLDRANVAFPAKLARAEREAEALLAAHRPRVVVSVGGYASLPTVLAARRRHVPIVAVCYDRRPGRATQLTARFAAASAVAFAGSGLPRAHLTGAPLRREILAVDLARDRHPARQQLGLPDDRFVVLVVGGSLGSAALNAVVSDLVLARRERDDLAVRHLVGERFAEGMGARAMSGAHGILYQVIGYEEQMSQAYAAADLVVSRAGASTVAELAAVGLPSILVPWPGAAADHQTDNAKALSETGAAVLLPEPVLSVARLTTEIDALVADPPRLAAMAAAARSAGAVHRSGRLAELIEEVAGR
jgi:undecaprenyldiphospho-muramoylpentapeptide beta-N-acetylglucosaminyltransferase